MTTTLTARSTRSTRSGGWWAVDVPEVQGLFAQARRLDLVPAAVLDAAALLTGRPESDFEVIVDPALDEDDLTAVRDARERRAALSEAEQAASAASRAAVARLRAEGLTVRDVAAIMDLSPQRVSQLLASYSGAWIRGGTTWGRRAQEPLGLLRLNYPSGGEGTRSSPISGVFFS